MYCSSCGAKVTPGLNFCNRCGTELGAKEQGVIKHSESFPESLVWAIVSVAVGGLAMLIGLMAVLKDVLHFSNELIVPITFLSFLLLAGAESVFIWMALRTSRAAKKANKTQPKELATKAIGAVAERALAEPVLSVTEHTTHTLEPARVERKTE